MHARNVRAALLSVLALGLVACGDEEATTEAAAVAAPTNRAPTIAGTPARTVIADQAYLFSPTASDPDGDPILFGIDGLPGWLTFNATTGRLSGTPHAGDVGVHRGIVVWVTDGSAEMLLPTIDIEVLPASAAGNRAPVISGTPADAVLAGSGYDFTPVATDADGDLLRFEIENRPGWASFDPAIGRLNGTPGSADIGPYAGIVIRVSDGVATAAVGPFAIAVNPPPAQNRAPLISGTPDPDVLAGQSWSFQPQASDPDGDALSFLVFGAPAWMGLDAATGILSGTPGAGQVGIHSGIQVVVSDGQASASLPAFSVQVVSTNGQPLISGSPPASITKGQPYSFTPTASDPNNDPLAFTVTGLPAWASFNGSTGRLSGTPAAAGTFPNIVITVSDGQASASLPSFSIVVVNTPPVISGTPPTSIARGQLYSFTPTASDANGDPLTFTATGLPSWATLNGATGQLSGTPPNTGTFSNIVITVRDGQAASSLPAFSIVVFAPNSPPVIGGNPAAAVLVGGAYSFLPTASDPNGDTLSFTVAGLPVWASFNAATGAVTGTPGAADIGLYTGISITVSDGAASATLGPFSIQVQSIATGTALLSWVPPTENTDGSPLGDLAGYVVYWGTSPGNYPSSVRLTNPGLTSYLIENLLPGTTYYFVTTAFNSANAESGFSNMASKSIP